MNRIYRLVWNEHHGAWVAVAETARSHGKSSGHTVSKAFFAALAATGFGTISALADTPATTVVPIGGATKAYVSANGVPVVNIQAANGAGLSHNSYTRYDVQANGLVLNNGNSSQTVRQSQLAGQVAANLNLVQEAKIILNEVVSTSRSTLAGFTEVLGGKADVIVANPNGITCNGCGFINTDRATLTTGPPTIAGDGSLTGFSVNRGDVLIGSAGVNATAQQTFDIVARSVRLDGSVNVAVAGTLGITVGNNAWNYAGRNVTGSVAGSGTIPSYAFDSTVLGGMYAGRIRIIATEAGVGVRMLGEAAASADDFTLSSAGKIEISAKLSAARDASLTTTSASGSQDLLLSGQDGKLSASRDLTLSATAGQINLAEGELYAANNLTLIGATLSDVSTATATRFAGVGNTLAFTGAAGIDGSIWGAGGTLSGTFGSLTIGAGGSTIYAGTTLGLSATANLALAAAAVRSVGDMTLAASTGTVSTTAGAAQGVQTTAGNLSLTAGSGLSNAGTMTADAGSATARVSGTFANSGTLHAKTTLDIADQTNGNSEDITNSGTLLADGGLAVKAAAFTNQAGGSVQGTTGTSLTASALTNAGTFIASNTAGQSGTFTLTTLNNSGTLQSAENQVFTVSGTLTNSGKLLATNNLTVSAGASALAMTNTSPGVIQAGNTLTIAGGNATFNTQSGTVLGNTVSLTVADLNNSGILQSNAGMTLAIGNGLSNSGTLLAKTSLTSNSASLTNSGTLEADQGSTITTGALSNTGTLIASDSASQAGTLNVATLSNTGAGVIQSARDLNINLSGTTLTNAARIIASKNLMLASTGGGLTVSNQSGGYLKAGSAVGDTLTLGGSAVVLNNSAGANVVGDHLALTLSSLTNAGTIEGGVANSTITASGTVSNSGTLTLANNAAGSGTVTADTLTNTGTLKSLGAASLNLATSLTNSGSLLAGGALAIRGTDSAYTVSGSGRMQSGGLLSVKGQGGGAGVDLTINGGGVMFGNSVDINAGAVGVGAGGKVTSTGNMSLAANLLNFGGTDSSIVAATSGTGSATVTLASAFSNIGAVHSGGNMSFSAPSITNTGAFSALNTLTVNATAGNFSNAGALYAGSQLNASATGTFTNVSGTGTIDSGGSMSLTAPTFVNNNDITATNNITITATTFKNETPDGDNRAWHQVSNTGNVNTSTSNWYAFPDNYETEYWKYAWRDEQYYTGGAPTHKPQIVGGNTVTITGFASGTNIGSLISGSTVNLTGNGGATFTNNDLSLNWQTWFYTFERYTHWIALGPLTYDDHVVRSISANTLSGAGQISNVGAGIRATTLNAAGFALTNIGSPYAAVPGSKTASGTTTTSLSGSATGTSPGTGVTGTTTASGAPAVSFGGLVIALPTNPNGYFVISKTPGSHYLVETNPLFAVGSTTVGSDYMEKTYGYNPDTIIKHLGDSNYEAYLVKQQLISQTGNNLLKGYGSEADQMKRLMSQAHAEDVAGRFTYGTALTADQVANLKDDIVWMVKVTVAGQTVLAPVVYLSAKTRNAIETGAVIAGDVVNMNLTAVTNTGGTISGTKSLNITSQGDITNTSGTIKGGDVSLKSTEGSIKNETSVVGSGDDKNYVTTIGKTAGITATGNLDLNAKKDITVLGADVKAGGDAALAAGGAITFDTIVDKTTTSSASGLDKSKVTTERNMGSTLSVGNNLNLKSGGDTTLAGTQASVGGDLGVDTGGNFKVIARQDKTTSQTETSTSGFGVGGGVWGSQKTTVDDFEGKNFKSTLTVGGSADIKAAKDMALQGSDLKIAGDAKIDASSVKVLDGLDERRTKTKVDTQTFLSMSSSSDSGASSESKSGSGLGAASASASAGANASNTSELNLYENRTATTDYSKQTSVGSNLVVGGNLGIKAKESVTVQGSNVESGGNLSVDAKNIAVLAGRNEEKSTTTTNVVKVGIYTDSSAGAKADASASATGASATAKAGASAEANADSTVTIGVRTVDSTDATSTVTHTSSSLKSGGAMTLTAKEEARFAGAKVESGGDMSIQAKDITNLAVQDSTTHTSSSTTTTVGVYLSGEASAKGEATAKAGPTGVAAKVEGSVSAEGSIGLRAAHDKSTLDEGTQTNVVSSFKSGGNITRTAQGTITDQGTQIEAAGNITQTATTLKEIAADDKAWSTKTSEKHDGRIGVYAGASAEAHAGAQAGVGGVNAGAGASAEASVGIKASYTMDKSSDSQTETKAVTSRYKAGGSISSTTTESTTLIGTQFEAGKDISIGAKTLDYQAARDTSTKTSSTQNISGEVKAKIVGSVGADVSGSYGQDKASSSSSTARVGGINAGGNLTIKTSGDARLEGTDIGAGGAAKIESTGGNVKFDAAKSTTSDSSQGFNASASVSVGKSGAEVGLGGGYQQSSGSSVTNTGVNIKAGSIAISAAKDMSLEGTKVSSKGDTTLTAGGKVSLLEAKDTKQSTSIGVQANADLSKESQSGGVNVKSENIDKQTGSVTSIQSGGNLKIKAGTIVSQDAELSAGGTKTLAGTVQTLKKTDVDKGSKVDIGIDFVNTGKKADDKKSGKDATSPGTTKADGGKSGTGGTQGSDGTTKSKADLAKWQGNQDSVVQQLKDRQSGATPRAAGTTKDGTPPGTTKPGSDSGKADLGKGGGASGKGVTSPGTTTSEAGKSGSTKDGTPPGATKPGAASVKADLSKAGGASGKGVTSPGTTTSEAGKAGSTKDGASGKGVTSPGTTKSEAGKEGSGKGSSPPGTTKPGPDSGKVDLGKGGGASGKGVTSPGTTTSEAGKSGSTKDGTPPGATKPGAASVKADGASGKGITSPGTTTSEAGKAGSTKDGASGKGVTSPGTTKSEAGKEGSGKGSSPPGTTKPGPDSGKVDLGKAGGASGKGITSPGTTTSEAGKSGSTKDGTPPGTTKPGSDSGKADLGKGGGASGKGVTSPGTTTSEAGKAGSTKDGASGKGVTSPGTTKSEAGKEGSGKGSSPPGTTKPGPDSGKVDLTKAGGASGKGVTSPGTTKSEGGKAGTGKGGTLPGTTKRGPDSGKGDLTKDGGGSGKGGTSPPGSTLKAEVGEEFKGTTGPTAPEGIEAKDLGVKVPERKAP